MNYNQENNGPLKGIRVIDLSLLLPGPLCSMHLADLGADVIKVENPRVPDLTRLMGSKIKGNNGTETGGLYYAVNRNKRAVTINIKRPAGREVLLKLLESADVLLEGFRPNTMSEMGIGYEQLKKKFPKLIYCAISGYGATGPYVNKAGHDGNYIAESGLLYITGEKNGKPVLPGIQIADIAGGTLMAVSGIMAALIARASTGKGQFVDVGMMDGAFSLLSIHAGELAASGTLPERGQMQLSGGLPNYSVYEIQDARHVMLGALEERFFRSFLRAIGHEDWLEEHDPAGEGAEELRSKLEQFFSTQTFESLRPVFENSECCLSPVLSPKEAFENPQLKHRNMSARFSDENFKNILNTGSPFHLSETPAGFRMPPPAHGEHTDEVLTEAGFSSAEIEDLRQKRAI